MRTPLCERLGCALPIFAFSHCRDVVVAVTKAGGFGVLGASTVSPEQLETELRWIDARTQGKPYGVDVIIPTAYDKRAETSLDELERLIPKSHRDFMNRLLAEAGVPELPHEDRQRVRRELITGRGAMTPEGARRLLEVALHHPQVKLVVSALGSPPVDVVHALRQHGVMIGAMCGKVEHATRHIEAGVELIVAQGTEAGGHTGEIATMVLVPQVVRACEGQVPVLAAGGIATGSQILAALALGAQGVWCGTVWLGTTESELDDFERDALHTAGADDAVRRKARTGKTVRMLKSALSEAWEQPDAPPYLPTPLQGVLYNEAHARVVRARRKDLYSFPAGQVVGMLHEQTSVREVMYRLQSEYAEAYERLRHLDPEPA